MGGGGLEVGHRQERVRRRLDPDEVGVRRRRAGLVEEDVPKPPALELGERDAGAVVGVLGERDRLARLEQREHDGGRRRRSRGEEDGLAALELAERALGLDPDRVRVARVVERPRLAVHVGPGRRAVERRLHGATIPRRRRELVLIQHKLSSSPSQAVLGELVSEKHKRSGAVRLRRWPRSTTRPPRSSPGCRSCPSRRSTPGTRRRSRGSGSGGSCSRGERVEKLLDPGSFVELDRYVRHRNPDFDSMANRPYGDAVVTGYGDDLRPQGLRLLPGLHRLRRLALRGLRREDLQGDGPGRQVRLPGDRDQRLGRGADPGGRRLARRLRGDLLAERPGLGRRAAALARARPVRRRRRLLARDHRLRPDGRGQLVHVHHRPRRREDGDGRGGLVRGARRRGDARRASRASRTSRRPTRRRCSRTRATCSRSCPRTTSSRRRTPLRRIRPTARRPSWTRSSRTARRSPTT